MMKVIRLSRILKMGAFADIDSESDGLKSRRAVHSSFLRHAEKAANDHGLDTRAILIELGRRKMVGGQEDMIADVALDMVRTRGGDGN